MGLLCCGTRPFFDKRKVGRVCSVLQQLVAESPGLSAGWLDNLHEYGPNLLHVVGLGRAGGDYSQWRTQHRVVPLSGEFKQTVRVRWG